MPDLDTLARPRAANPSNSRKPARLLGKALALHALAGYQQRSLADVQSSLFAGSPDVLRAVDVLHKSAAGIADTTTTGWASELVGTLTAEFAAALVPVSAFGQLRTIGPAFELSGPMVVPVQEPSAGPSGAAWVGESGAIPVLQRKIAAGRLDPRKVAGIVPFSDELAGASTSQIERVLQSILMADLAELIDKSLTDAQPASTMRPAGLLFGVTPIASVDAGADIAALAAAMAAAKAILPALIVAPERIAGLWGDFAFGAQLATGRLGPFRLVLSNNMADPASLIALDAASFASALGTPDISTSQSAVLAMADAGGTAPTQAIDLAGALGTPGEVLPDGGIHVAGPPAGAGTAGVVAMSMLQQAATALRVVEPTAWVMTRPGAVAAVTGAAW